MSRLTRALVVVATLGAFSAPAAAPVATQADTHWPCHGCDVRVTK